MALSQRERDRLKVLHEVEQGHLRQRQGAEQVGLSERGFRKLLKRFREQGDGALAHGLRGRRSNRGLAPETAAKAVAAVKQHYGDFGPTLAAEYLRKDRGIAMSRETLRRLLIREGVWKAKPGKIREAHVWRPRRSCRGELIQWDTSIHAWLEDRGPEKMYLIGLIDDATSRLFARFVPADSTEQHMAVLWAYVERHGRPQSVYTDKASLFQPTLAPGWKEEEPGPKTETDGTSVPGIGDRMDRRSLASGQRTDRALLRDVAGSAGERTAKIRSKNAGRGQPVSGTGVSEGVERALRGRAGQRSGCPPATGGDA